ncbi:unnamed protein product [Effrenium voratum]|uniref:N-alpha-acetyltransferase 35, NatC auxiliary subunit n=1 Tax=Effrenium voratum TaxID=2562239 RepID=A0AA36JN47_9DINO|nr:unnamed protein product [Effrenium voratum]CAJ1416894.1 unnamed protein product [Effrenium voratum]
MPEDEEEEEELEDGKGDTKKKKPRKKKKKKKSQEDEEPDEAPLNYWPAPEGLDLDRPPGQNEEWVDITSLCDLAVSGMNLGEMVESPSFRLYDAMSAIEIMDPKMDTGYKSHEDMTLERAEKLGLVSAPSPEVLTGVMDHLLMYYLLWLDGHTIIQTCFSCLYLQDLPRLLAIPALGSFVDAFLIACQSARDAITCAGVYDDEDFMPTMFGVDLQACVFSSDWQKANEKLKSEQDRLVAEGCEAAALRLNFMGKYMSALVSLMARVPNVASAKAHLAKCSQLLPRLAASATEPSDAVKQRFDASSQRKLLVPGPPRTVEPIEDPKVVFRMWTSHVNELVECCSAQTRHLNDLLQGVIKQKEKPNVLSRSMAQLVFDQSFVRRSLQEILELFLFPPEALQHCRKQAEPFLQRCESMFLHLLKLAHLNVARRFRRLAHVFPDFNELQHEAWRLDEALKSTFGANLLYNRPSWVFIMEYALQAMISKLLLGFQLELYEEAEFHMIYWYVDYLFGLRIYNLNVLCVMASAIGASGGGVLCQGKHRQEEVGRKTKGRWRFGQGEPAQEPSCAPALSRGDSVDRKGPLPVACLLPLSESASCPQVRGEPLPALRAQVSKPRDVPTPASALLPGLRAVCGLGTGPGGAEAGPHRGAELLRGGGAAAGEGSCLEGGLGRAAQVPEASGGSKPARHHAASPVHGERDAGVVREKGHRRDFSPHGLCLHSGGGQAEGGKVSGQKAECSMGCTRFSGNI